MPESPNIDPIVAAVASELSRSHPEHTIGAVVLSVEVLDRDGNLIYGFMNNGVGHATETMLIAARLQALASDPPTLSEEPD